MERSSVSIRSFLWLLLHEKLFKNEAQVLGLIAVFKKNTRATGLKVREVSNCVLSLMDVEQRLDDCAVRGQIV